MLQHSVWESFLNSGGRELKQGTGRQDVGKEEDYLDFDMKFPTRRQNLLGINILCPSDP